MNAVSLPQSVAIPAADPSLVSGVDSALDLAREFKIDSKEMYEVAAGELREIVARKNRLEKARTSMKAPVLDAGRAIDGFFKPLIDTLEQAERIYKRGMISFEDAERQRVAEEERRAREEAEAERRRIEEEALRRAQEIEAQQRAEAEALAAELRAEGDEEGAKEIVQQAQEQAAAQADEVIQTAAAEAQTVTVVTPFREAPRAAGTSSRENWKGEVVDVEALIKAAASGHALAKAIVTRALQEVGAKVLTQQAKSLKGELNSVPGVRAFDDRSIAVRGAR